MVLRSLQSTPLSSSQRPRVNPRIKAMPPSGIRAFFDLVAGRADVISLGVGEPDFVTPWHITEAGIHSLEIGHTCYTSNSGLFALREEIGEYLKRYHEAHYNPIDEILITCGGSEALDLVFRVILQPGEEVIVVDPSFVSYAPLAELAGGVAHRLASREEEGFVPTREQLDEALTSRTRALIVNYPNNPTGAILSQDRLEMIADFVIRNDLLLISDEIYLPLTYEGEPRSFAAVSELRDRLILIHGFSKAWAMTGWRLGFAAGPSDVIEAMTKIHQYSLMCVSTPAQYAAIEALRGGDEDVARMKKEYDARRRFMIHHLNRIGLNCYAPMGAFYVFPSIQSTGLQSQEFAKRLLEEENVAVAPGNAFGACGEGFIRCSYATSLEDLRKAIQRIDRKSVV